MQFEIVFTPDDAERVTQRYNKSVAEKVEKAVKTKNETLEWKQSLNGAKKRFHNVVETNGECFPEVMVSANQSRYRAILGWIEGAQKFAFLIAVEKEEHYQTSRQHDIIDAIDKNPHELIHELEDKMAAIDHTATTQTDSAEVRTKY